MKTKKMVLILTVVVLSLSFVGCNALNAIFDNAFLSVSEVKASDIDSYDSSAGEVSSKTDIDQGLSYVLQALQSEAPARAVLGDDYEAILNVLEIAAPDVARVIVPESAVSRKIDAGINASITEESFTDGVMIVDVEEMSFSADASVDSLENPTKATAKFDTKVDIGISDIVDSLNNITIEDMKLRANGNGNGTMTFSGGYPERVDYYTALAVSVGFSLTAPGCSGKYLASFKFVVNATVDDSSQSYSGDEELEITVSVYNNSGSLIETQTYTESYLTGGVY